MDNYEDIFVRYNDRILDILVFVLSEITEGEKIEEINIEKLIQKGYSEIEISAAISWLVDKVEIDGSMLVFSKVRFRSKSFRILNSSEKLFFSPIAWSKILEYQELGLLSLEQVEFIIFRSFAMNVELTTIEDVNSVVSKILFHFPLNLPSGSKVMLDAKDKVN